MGENTNTCFSLDQGTAFLVSPTASSTVSENMALLFTIWFVTSNDGTVSQRAVYLMLVEGIKMWTSVKDLQGMFMNQHILLFLETLAQIIVIKIFICTECIHHSLWFSSPW